MACSQVAPLRRVLVGHRPSRCLGRGTDALAQIVTAQLDDSAIGVVVEAAAEAINSSIASRISSWSCIARCVLVCESQLAKRGERANLRIDLRATGNLAAAVKYDVKRPPDPTSEESSCLSDPAVALRGLANSGSPSASRVRFIFKPDRVMITSPRASNTAGASACPSGWSRSGMLRMVRSSP